MVTTLAVQRFEAELLRYESHRYDILQDIVEAENRVNVLCGRYPQSVPRRSDEFRDTSPGSVSSGLPSEMLVRRPDIRAAELDLQAARLDVKVARARFFPSLVIDAELGAEAFSLLKFGVMPASLLYDVAARLMAPLFNRAEIKADYFAANGRQMQAVYGYEQTVLRAFTEVANQLAQIENVDQSYALKERQVSVLHDATATANLLFSSARADYLEVLTTRREALEAEFELIETKRRQMGARIDLYRSLGGGWPQQDPTTDDDATRQVAPGGE